MSHFYISPTIGDGTYDNMFRPLGMDTDSGASSIQIADTGQWLIWVPELIIDSRLTKLAEHERDIVMPRSARTIQSKLALSPNTLIVGEDFGCTWFDLMRHGKLPGNPLRPCAKSGCYELTMAGRVLCSEPATAKKHSQNFADEFGDGEMLGWTTIVGSFVDNGVLTEVTHDVAQTNLYTRFEIPCDTPDMESEITIAVRVGGSPKIGAGALVRKDDTDDATFYYFSVRSTVSESEFGRLDNGVFNLIGSRTSISDPVDDTFSCSADGSTMIGRYNGIQHVNTTDTNLPGNTKAGMYGRTANSPVGMRTDLSRWTAADILSPLVFPIRTGPY